MRIVIAGGTGFLGGPLAEVYAEEGHDVRVLTRSLGDLGVEEPPARSPRDMGRHYRAGTALHHSGEQALGRVTATLERARYAAPGSVADADAERIARGVSGTVHAVGGLRLRFTITDVDLVARRWSWLVRFGPVQMDLHHEVRAVPGGGSVTGLVLQGPAPVVTAYAPLAWVALRRLVAR